MTRPTPPTDKASDFVSFMRAYQDLVFSTASRLLANDAQAEDVAQEVFLKAYESFEQLHTSPTAGGWLKTVATRMALNHLSRYRRRWRFFTDVYEDDDAAFEASPLLASSESILSNLDAGERREFIERALRRLPEHQRVALVLYHFEDLPYEQIAQQLNVSLAKVKTDIHRARAALARALTTSGMGRETLQS